MPNLNISNDWAVALTVGGGLAAIGCLLVATAIFVVRNWPEGWNGEIWREILPRLSLPTLALAASFGVFEFSLLFVPHWVAIATATSFECTYVGLSVVKNLPADLRKRARRIAQGAVVVSILYNVLSGLFDRNPQILRGSFDWEHQWPQIVFLEMPLACIHGVPLALVAFLTADLLLHSFSPQFVTSSPVNPQTEATGRLWQELTVTLGQLNRRIGGLEQNLTEVASEIGNLKAEEVQPAQPVTSQTAQPTFNRSTPPGFPVQELHAQLPLTQPAAGSTQSSQPLTSQPTAAAANLSQSAMPVDEASFLAHTFSSSTPLHATALTSSSSNQPYAAVNLGEMPATNKDHAAANPPGQLQHAVESTGQLRAVNSVTGQLRAATDPLSPRSGLSRSSSNNPTQTEISRLLAELTPVSVVAHSLSGEAADSGGDHHHHAAASLTNITLLKEDEVVEVEESGAKPMKLSGTITTHHAVRIEAQAAPADLTLEGLLRAVGLEHSALLEKLAASTVKRAEQALAFLVSSYPGVLLPGLATMTIEEFQPLYQQLVGATGSQSNWQAPDREKLEAMKPVERDYTAYQMKQQGYSNPQIAAAFGKNSGNSAREWHRAHAVRFGLSVLS